MRHTVKVGISFGTTSGIITTLGLMIGLASGTNSKLAVIGGVLTIAIADALSDSLGIHISEESENKHSSKEIWEAAISTFICKFLVASSFVIPIVLLGLKDAVVVSIFWGMLLLGVLSYYIGKGQRIKTINVIVEHLAVAVVVIVIAHYIGYLISITFT